MTFEELDERFPNGFDDATITLITIDYGRRSARLDFGLRCNLPESRDRDVYERGVLSLRGIYYVSIEPPDADHLLWPDREKITVDGLPEDSHAFPLFAQLESRLPAGAFCCRFFVHDWNSFIHIAAEDAEFSRAATNHDKM